MAKRSAKDPAPDDGEQRASFPIPEVSPPKIDPWEEIAATVPRLPGEGGVTAGLAKPKSKPNLKAPMDDYDAEALQRTRANQGDPSVTLYRPARGPMNTLGTELLGDCAIKNELGNREPGRAMITRSSDRQWLFFMPTHHKSGKGVEITYQDKQAYINFFGPFQDMGKLVPKGYRQKYYLEMTDEPITIHGITGYALYFSLADYQEEAVNSREEAEAQASARAKTSSTAKANSNGSTSSKAGETEKSSTDEPSSTTKEGTGAPSPGAADLPEEEEDDDVMFIKELNEAIESRDAEIDELKAKVRAYKEKFGQL